MSEQGDHDAMLRGDITVEEYVKRVKDRVRDDRERGLRGQPITMIDMSEVDDE